MLPLLLRRITRGLVIVAVSTLASFALLRLAPGDAVAESTMHGGVTAEARALARSRLGVDRPLHVQLGRYVRGALAGDLGTSNADGRPVVLVLRESLPATLLLSGTALALAAALGVGVGTWQGWHAGHRLSRLVANALTAIYAVPELVLGIVLLATVALWGGLLPVGGMHDPLLELTGSRLERVTDRLRHLALPATTLALSWCAAIMRQQRVSVHAVAREHFVRTARAKGAAELRVMVSHVLRVSLPGTLATIGTFLPALVGGTVVVESLFAWPGMGVLLVRAVSTRDAPVVAGAVILIAGLVAVGSTLVELAVLALDPRARRERR